MDTNADDRPERSAPSTAFVTGLLLFITCSLAIVILAGLGITVGWHTYEQVKPTASKLYAAEYTEWAAAQAEHEKILAISEECPTDGALKLDDRFTEIVPPNQRTFEALASPTVTTPLAGSGYLLAAIHLSADIGEARVEMARKQVFEDISMQVFAWVGVLVGALTTILISVKSMTTERMRIQFSIGLAAIVFSALGTMVTALNSFYTAKVTYERTTSSLANLRQLHEELATGITREGLPIVCQDRKTAWPNDWRYKRIKLLTAQYIAVVAAAQLTAPQPEGATADEPDSGNPKGAPTVEAQQP